MAMYATGAVDDIFGVAHKARGNVWRDKYDRELHRCDAIAKLRDADGRDTVRLCKIVCNFIWKTSEEKNAQRY